MDCSGADRWFDGGRLLRQWRVFNDSTHRVAYCLWKGVSVQSLLSDDPAVCSQFVIPVRHDSCVFAHSDYAVCHLRRHFPFWRLHGSAMGLECSPLARRTSLLGTRPAHLDSRATAFHRWLVLRPSGGKALCLLSRTCRCCILLRDFQLSLLAWDVLFRKSFFYLPDSHFCCRACFLAAAVQPIVSVAAPRLCYLFFFSPPVGVWESGTLFPRGGDSDSGGGSVIFAEVTHNQFH